MVSIIIPIYNNSKEEIERCVSSAANQTYQNLEILLIDDGSKKEIVLAEKEIAQKYSRVRIIEQQNMGVSQARNRGLDEAKGEFVCFIDADDYVEENMVEKMLAQMDEESLVSINFVHNDSNTCVLHIERDVWEYEFNEEFLEAYFNGSLGKQIAFSACNKMFRLAVIRDHMLYFPIGVAVGEDMIFVLQYLAYCKKIQVINEGLYHYSIRETSVMNAVEKDYLDIYCNTLKGMQYLCIAGKHIPETILGNWMLEVLTYILSNRYVSNMTYRQFCEYYSRLIQSSVVAMAIKGKMTRNFKRDVLRFVLKIQSKHLLYGIIKVNR